MCVFLGFARAPHVVERQSSHFVSVHTCQSPWIFKSAFNLVKKTSPSVPVPRVAARGLLYILISVL